MTRDSYVDVTEGMNSTLTLSMKSHSYNETESVKKKKRKKGERKAKCLIVYRTSEEEEESKIVRFRIGPSMKRKKKKEGSVVYRAIGNEEEMMFSEDQVMNEGRVYRSLDRKKNGTTLGRESSEESQNVGKRTTNRMYRSEFG